MSIFSNLFGKKQEPEPENSEPAVNPYLENEDLWRNWQNYGVTENTIIEVDFQFISKTPESAKEFTEVLQKAGQKASYKEFKGYAKHHQGQKAWDINLKFPPQTWTLERLNQQAREYHHLAVEQNCALDGLGAMIAKK